MTVQGDDPGTGVVLGVFSPADLPVESLLTMCWSSTGLCVTDDIGDDILDCRGSVMVLCSFRRLGCGRLSGGMFGLICRV